VCEAQITRDSIPGTLESFEMVAIPAVTATIAGKDVQVPAFLIGRTELSWDAYDAYMLSKPTTAEKPPVGADAVSRPSRPYGAPDYGWGHRGFPAISVARGGAESFCAWLSTRTGKRYRLPTEAEWVRAATLASGGKTIPAARMDALAWHAGNATATTHASGKKQADLIGLYDLFGNAAEWVTTDDGKYVARGGSFRNTRKDVGPQARAEQDDSWQERDPQIPKSRWWLSDGPFIGFRIVREP
jgi:formylglycine-generating enzyme required for sulfatase activity